MPSVPFLVLFATALQTPASRPLTPPDSAPGRRPDSLETVVVRAIRAPGTPMAESTVDRPTLRRNSAGQDLPLLLQQVPGLTVANDAGGFANYSYVRVRGVDQTRLNLTLDGVPLNDPEDQVFYFTNFADLAGALGSVQLQRGVGSSSFGTTGFGGSLNMESAALGTGTRGGELVLGGGAFDTRRLAAEYRTGLLGGRWAAFARVAGHETDGFRDHSGNQARSAFGSVGWFGDRDVVKASWLVGRSRNQLAYLAADQATLRANRRANPLTPEERDDFTQQVGRVQWTRALGAGQSASLVAYHNQAQGEYDVRWDADLLNYTLRHQWTGLIATWGLERGAWRWDAGAHANRYWRDHGMRVRPNLRDDAYLNTGHKAEQSVFVKGARQAGAWRWFGDLQLRHARFRYEPTAGSGFEVPAIGWTFANPKLGVVWAARPGITARASWGRTHREPARTDLFAGADDLDAAAWADLGSLRTVRPERVDDLEAGVAWERPRWRAELGAFFMAFRDEIAPIGALTPLGVQRRANVDRSARAGVEAQGTWRAHDRVELRGNATWMRARIAEYVDQASGARFRDVAPLLTPALTANAELLLRGGRGATLSLRGRHVGQSFLANDGDRRFMTPAFAMADVGLDWVLAGQTVSLQVNNLLDARIEAAGYHDGSTAYFFPMAGRHLLATVRVGF